MNLIKYLPLLIFVPPLILGGAGAAFTSHKLNKMRQIRGMTPGATVETHFVKDKWHQPPNTFWLTWTDKNIERVGKHRLNLPKNLWDKYDIGDEIEIIFVPGDSSPYYRDGIFASDGNFAFDYVLIMFEFGMMFMSLLGGAITFWFIHRSNKRASY